PASLADTAIEPGDAKYARVRNTYLRGGAPGLVLQVRDAGQVAEALAFARSQPVPLAVRSAGHGISGRSTNDGGIVIDLSRLNRIEVLDEGSRRVRIEPGARWMDVATALAPHGLAITSGDYGGVGVGGLATAGGVGYFAREQGLTIDHVRRMHVVLADGTELEVSDVEHPDLFWAMRGAGANFGVVTSFEFEAHEGGDVGWAQLVFDASDPAGFLERWGRAIEAAPRSVTGQVILGSRIPGQPMLAQALIVVHESDPDAIVAALQPIADIAPMLQQSVQLAPYAAVMANVRGGYHEGRGEPLSRSGLIEHLTPEFSRAAADVLDGGLSHFFSIRAVGGAVADVPEDAMAYSGRSANFALAAMGSQREFADAWRESLVPHSSGVYISFDTEDSDDVVERAFPPGKLARLRELKWRYDPENVFRDNFNVLPRVPDQEPAAL
ncbi:MAG TPA: FAD-binding oxidoreductase, partial [Alphaproteobacteria bacterium]|nr:FAD-binding oxidoreductase [Alphaproteobacteria bacterium]